ncbi:glycogen synthase GlgA [Novosphingobium sediminicola]|uniref:Glycogen synthase n=1 Tax=Novosphingobium sediminicola TaxID=563162 RepID=A0A7W6G670_9SPHN|nr:glycogen synthase GlgA [Novosphingobium sediminicola]MBB3954988.1 starch synthase [Novosphingobium sediminicola]
MTLRVLSLASEAVPFIKTGGLADVAGALPAAVAPHGVAMTTMLPGYPGVLARLSAQYPVPKSKRAKAAGPKVLHEWEAIFGHRARLLAGTLDGAVDGAPVLVLDCPALFDRPGGPYGNEAGQDWPDNGLRFAVFARAAADVAGGIVEGMEFDLLHAHDWQSGLAPAYLKFAPYGGRSVPSVMTIHNMAFQGHFPAALFHQIGLPPQAWAVNGVEYHGGVGMLKAGLEAAHAITTVSPTYALEIREPHFGMGLEGLIRSRGAQVHGIVNGIDPVEWNPATDPAIKSQFTARSLAKRQANKRALEKEFSLESDDGPLFIVVSRLTWQKGMDVLAGCLDHLAGLGGRLALLGSGDAGLVGELSAAAARHPGRIALRIGYDEALSHRMQAGGDAILVPSRFEPCGLTQLYGLAYGCVPVVARTGGLADTVVDANLAAVKAGAATGVQFAEVDHDALCEAITRTISLYHKQDVWRAMQKAGMLSDFTWTQSGGTYAALYRSIALENSPA